MFLKRLRTLLSLLKFLSSVSQPSPIPINGFTSKHVKMFMLSCICPATTYEDLWINAELMLKMGEDFSDDFGKSCSRAYH